MEKLFYEWSSVNVLLMIFDVVRSALSSEKHSLWQNASSRQTLSEPT
ncbi:MAG: hypothetical protein CFH06_01345 [Alphaproteobacteria bacterium MarineAlpha3_Bin5]|nr:MAG: hypothetical protein CFH06_01345 [Alphaproteobacteria bacterium MarineAlpha3_Bin5]